jgi:hypothetical protein
MIEGIQNLHMHETFNIYNQDKSIPPKTCKEIPRNMKAVLQPKLADNKRHDLSLAVKSSSKATIAIRRFLIILGVSVEYIQ